MSKLKPCPFCGKSAQVMMCDDEGRICYNKDKWAIYHSEKEDVECPVANSDFEPIGSRYYNTKQEAIDAWNRRISQNNNWWNRLFGGSVSMSASGGDNCTITQVAGNITYNI